MIRYLETEEKNRCRALWNEAFPEDSEAFCDYYFDKKTKDNRILVCEEDGEIVSMLHRNPYRIFMRGTETECDYIVGVATAVSERHKGHMRSLMIAALHEMQKERMPFVFLMPARESLYLPFDFRYVFDQPRWVLRYAPQIRKEPLHGTELLSELAEWQNAWLKGQYDVFAVRDEAYLSRMQEELESEDGTCRLIYNGENFIGMESEWGLEKREMRYLYASENYRTEAGERPAVMARIVSLPEFMGPIRLAGDCPENEITIELGVQDMLIPYNQGTWLWKIDKNGSQLTQESRFMRRGKTPVFTIAELTQWLFGYREPPKLRTLPLAAYIEPFHGVFLDEVV